MKMTSLEELKDKCTFLLKEMTEVIAISKAIRQDVRFIEAVDVVSRDAEIKRIIDRYAEMVATAYDIPKYKLYKSSRRAEYTIPKHLFRYVCREYLGIRLHKLSKLFSCHHSTILHSVDFVEGQLKINSELGKEYTQKLMDLKLIGEE